MTIHVCCLLAMLMMGPGAEAMEVRAGALSFPEPDLLISNNEALADINHVCVSLVTPLAYTSFFEGLAAQVVEALEAEGIGHLECRTGVTPRLHIRIETVSVKDSGRTVYRVQTALSQIVTLTDPRAPKIQAEVWRLRPVMKVVADSELADAVAQAVVMQAKAFAAACQAAQRLRKRLTDADQTSTPQPTVAPQKGVDTPASSVTQGPFVASKSSSVFHRPDCRWARNIAERNRVTYRTRAEAIQAGKRPCKSCKP